jgi:hypothetical protein
MWGWTDDRTVEIRPIVVPRTAGSLQGSAKLYVYFLFFLAFFSNPPYPRDTSIGMRALIVHSESRQPRLQLSASRPGCQCEHGHQTCRVQPIIQTYGLGSWSAAAIKRLIRSGLRICAVISSLRQRLHVSSILWSYFSCRTPNN